MSKILKIQFYCQYLNLKDPYILHGIYMKITSRHHDAEEIDHSYVGNRPLWYCRTHPC